MELTKKDSAGLKHRMDVRTKKKFNRDVKVGTSREKLLAPAWRELLLRNNLFSRIDIEDYGMDNTGKLVIDSRKVNGKADFKFYFYGGDLFPDGKVLIEIKYVICTWKATLKEEQVKSYIKDGATVLFVWGEGEYNPKFWALASPAQLQYLLDDMRNKNRIISDPNVMGGKPSMIVSEREFGNYFSERREWHS